MKKITILIIFTFCFQYFHSVAQTPATYNSADIYMQLKKLNVLGSVLYIAAHPDDENTRLLAFFAKEKLYRTGYLSLTRGDGGQNLIGNEQGIELGLIRTQELLSARRIDGAEQFFSRAYDFGYSKSAEEAMRIWNKEKILSDVVWMIRKFQPDVIITRFPGDERAGHGHHAASSLLANEAFTAAADATKFPEQLQFVKPWQAKRILWNTFNFGGNNTTAEDQLKIDVGTYNPLLGKGYGEIASESRSQHKSQGFGVPRQRGISLEYFKTTGGSAPQKDLMDSVVIDWSRVQGGGDIQAVINKIIADYSFEHPENSVASLVGLYRQLKHLPEGYWQTIKLKEMQQLIEACSGLYAEAATQQQQAIPGDSLKINILLNKRNNVAISVKEIMIKNGEENGGQTLTSISVNKPLATNESSNNAMAFKVEDNAKPSQPYWLQNAMSPGSFNINDQQIIGKAESSPAFVANISYEIDGLMFETQRSVQYKNTDPVKGELFQPVAVLPKLTVQQEPSLLVNTKENMHNVKLRYKANGSVSNVLVNANKKSLISDNVAMAKGMERIFETPVSKIHLELVKGNMARDTFTLANNQQAVYPVFIHYDHIPNITYFKPAILTILNLDIKIAGKRIGYIDGAGDKVPQALEQIGYAVTKLGENDLTAANLQQFDAVITGIRAYNVNTFMGTKYNDLMAYVKNGGNLIVQYNTAFQGASAPKIGPYPFTISRTRITDETAAAHVDLPNHVTFNSPNKITVADFDEWIQERSIYQAEQVDSNYVAPISMADPGEKASNGSLIIGKYGKGNFVYTGLVFFRELPAGVAGAYRLMANLIALPKNK